MKELDLTEPNRTDPGPDFDPLTIDGVSLDQNWKYRVRFVASPTGLKAWSLTVIAAGSLPGGEPPADVSGAGINTGTLKAISFPQLRRAMKKRADERVARVLDEKKQTAPADVHLVDRELARAQDEAARSGPPRPTRIGRPRTSDDERARWALDVLEFKDRPSYRKELRSAWSQRENRRLGTKTVDTRMKRLKDDRWLTGYGRLASIGPALEAWLDSPTGRRSSTTKE